MRIINVRMSDSELMLWATLHSGARWEAGTREFCVLGLRYSCKVDGVGLPEISDNLRTVLRRAFTESEFGKSYR